MNSMGAQAVLVLAVLLIGTVKAEDEIKPTVSFWKEKFKMTCPGNGTWFKNRQGPAVKDDSQDYEKEYSAKTRGEYYCHYKDPNDENTFKYYYFYVQGKACEHCYELDATLILLAVVADVLGTIFVMMIIYRCTKKKNSPGPQTPKAPARPGGRVEAAQSSAYEPLRHQTRSQDTYNVLNRTG